MGQDLPSSERIGGKLMAMPVLDYHTPSKSARQPREPGYVARTWCLVVSYCLFPGVLWLLGDFWAAPSLVGCAGILFLIASDLVDHWSLLLLGLLGLVLSLGLTLVQTGHSSPFVLALSTPFLAMLLAKAAVDLVRTPC